MGNILTIKDANLSFDKKGIPGLHGINLNYNSPGLYVIQGPSGCGKTTLFRAIDGQLKLESGSIDTHGNKVGMMPKPDQLNLNQKVLDLLVEHCLKKLTDISEEKAINLAREALMMLEITNEMNKLVSDLSAGQQQRVMLAMALINRPQIILLDEPFSILEANTRKQIIGELQLIIEQNNLLVLWITHQSEEALEFSQSIALMNFGKIVQQDTPENIYFSPNSLFSAKYYGENNIYAVKVENQEVELPWGKLKLPASIEVENGKNILAITRPQLFKVSDQGKFNAKISKQSFKGQYFSYSCKLNGHPVYLQSTAKITGDSIKFDIDECDILLLKEI